MTSQRAFPRLFSAVCVLAASSAFAQIGAAVLTGTVTDAASKTPVADVVVTATSPNLQGEQVVVTDSSGVYRIPQLPPGTYTIRAEKETYKPYSRGDINLRADATTRVNVEVLPEALQGQDIVIVGKPPTIDVGSSTTGVDIGSDFVKNFAVAGNAARSFESLAEVAPGANQDHFGTSIAGTTSPENNYVVDGLSVNDPGFGTNGAALSIEFIQEVNVISGGFLPEYGRAQGGVLNVVTKSGSNEFHGSIFGTYTPGALAAVPKAIPQAGTVFTTNYQQLWNQGDFGVEIGGPILKDKLWFFAGMAPNFSRSQFTRDLGFLEYTDGTKNADGSTHLCSVVSNGSCTSPVIDPKTGFQLQHPFTDSADHMNGGKALTAPPFHTSLFSDSKELQYIGKLTYLINQDHNISITTYGTPGNQKDPLRFGAGGQYYGIGAGTESSLGAHTYQTTNDVVIKEASSFADKHFLIDVSVGWHHQANGVHPIDDSLPGSTTGLAGTPAVEWRRGNATTAPHSILDFENLGADAAGICEPAGTTKPGTLDVNGNPIQVCPIQTYNNGGPGFINDSALDRYSGRLVGTYILKALGHHVLKAGFDGEHLDYQNDKAYSGQTFFRESRSGNFFADFRQYGFMTAADQPYIQLQQIAHSQANTVGGFVQDSWQILDLFTLAGGFRYDAQTIIGADGQVGLALPNQWSPRIGLIYDFTQQGRSKIAINYARFFEGVPLDISDRSFPGERQVGSEHSRAAGCNNPADPNQWNTPNGACRTPANLAPINANSGGFADPSAPNQFWTVTGGDREPVDPNVQPESTDEISAQAEYEVISDGRLGASYTHRQMNNIIEDMSRDEGSTYFIGNPGYGIAADFPKATRNYDAVSLYFTKNFADLWQAQGSVTWSNLVGNWSGLFRPESNQLDPNINSDFDLISLLPNRYGHLPGDRTWVVKAYAAKEFVITGSMSVTLGLSYIGQSGTPILYLGSHPLYGPDEAYILPRDAGGRTPWTNNIDSHLAFTYRLSKDMAVTLGVDVFNLFNFQDAYSVDNRYTNSDVLPIFNAGSPCTQDASNCAHPATFKDLETINPDGSITTKLVHPDGTPFVPSTERNPDFKNVASYQSPRQVRFLARFTF